jgi:hypothetical protein
LADEGVLCDEQHLHRYLLRWLPRSSLLLPPLQKRKEGILVR